MSPTATASPDKTIVERRIPHAGNQSRQAVKNARAGLGFSPSGKKAETRGFEYDLLKRHALLQPYALLGATTAAALGHILARGQLGDMIAGIWFCIFALIAFAGHMYSKRFLEQEPDQARLKKAKQMFIAATASIGCTWAAIYAVYPIGHEQAVNSVSLYASLSVVMGLGYVCARYIKYGVLIAALPSAAVIIIKLILETSISALAVALLICVALAFFHYISTATRRSYISFLKSRAERDQLIMELESARGVSEEARRRAEDSNLAKSRFLATMSHELRTPLNAILGFSEVMENEVMGPLNNAHYKEYIGDIHRSGAHLLKLINEILDLSRVEAGRYELNEEATSLADVAEESQQMVKLKASDKNVSLVMQVQPNLPQIWADERAIRQVMLNLLANALKFTPSGGSIWLKVGWTAGGGQYVSIKDTGPGIPAEEIPIVLSSFGQGSIAIKSAEQGTGLGLPIVQALVQMHDGKFELKSKLREGTEVIATFPRSRIMDNRSGASAPFTKAGAKPGERRRVDAPSLVV